MREFSFAAFPYVALFLAIVGGVYRYYANRFSFSSLSSQFLENRLLFWGAVPWHYGIILVLLAHLFGGIFPSAAGFILGDPIRLLVAELIGLGLALLAGVGLFLLMIRRLANPKARAVTSPMDSILLTLLAIQVAAGVFIALAYRWGSLWYLHAVTPWFWSIAQFRPDFSTIQPLPWVVQLHALNGFLLILLFPFTRLVHIFTVPLSYLWRPFQVAIWNQAPVKWEEPEVIQSRTEVLHPATVSRTFSESEIARRQLLKWATGILSLAVSLAVVIPLIAAILGPIFRREKLQWAKAGDVASLPQGRPADVTFPMQTVDAYIRKTETHRIWVVKHSSSSVTVFSPICPHLGCHYNWAPQTQHFECPCHGSVYSLAGQVLGGPAPRPLDTLPAKIENGQLYIQWEVFRVGIPEKIRA